MEDPERKCNTVPMTLESSAQTLSDGGPRVEAIDRALQLLLTLAKAGTEGSSLRELCTDTGISKATAYRALSTLRGRGFVTQSLAGDYVLGPQSLALGQHFFTGDNLGRSLKPALVELSQRAEELVHLGMWDGNRVVYLDKVEPGARAIRVWSSIGQRVPAASSALGRALLGAESAIDVPLESFIRALPPGRDVSVERLRAAIHEMRTTGFASETEENEPGVACLAVALMRNGSPLAAISITSLASRMTPERRDHLKGLIHEVVPPRLPDGVTLFSPR